MIPDQDFLKVEQVMDLLAAAFDQKDAFSVVRIGDDLSGFCNQQSKV